VLPKGEKASLEHVLFQVAFDCRIELLILGALRVTQMSRNSRICAGYEGGGHRIPYETLNDEVLLSSVRYALEQSRLALAHASELQELGQEYGSLTSPDREMMALLVFALLDKQAGGAGDQRDYRRCTSAKSRTRCRRALCLLV